MPVLHHPVSSSTTARRGEKEGCHLHDLLDLLDLHQPQYVALDVRRS